MSAKSIIVGAQKRRLSELRPYARNPRAGDVDAITQSMETNGIFNVLIVDVRTNEILAGNHRYEALLADGQTDAYCVFVQPSDNDHAARINLADNRLSDIARMDEGLLADLLADLPGLDGTGYDTDFLNKLLAKNEQSGDQSFDLKEQWSIIVNCRSEKEQRELLERLEAEGLSCKALIA